MGYTKLCLPQVAYIEHLDLFNTKDFPSGSSQGHNIATE